MPRRLDAPQCPAQLIDLPLVRERLPLRQFHQFQNLVQLIDRMLQRFRDLRRVQHRLMDRRGIRLPEIRRLHPLLWPRRFLARLLPMFLTRLFRWTITTLWPVAPILALITFRTRRRRLQWRRRGFRLAPRFRRAFRHRLRRVKSFAFVGRRFFRMRLAKTTFGIRLRLRPLILFLGGVLGGFRSRWQFLSVRRGLVGGGRTRCASTATAAASSPAASGRPARSGGGVQVGMFVRHSFSRGRMAAWRVKAIANCFYFLTNRASEAV